MRSRWTSSTWMIGLGILLASTGAMVGCAAFLADLLGIEQVEEAPADEAPTTPDNEGEAPSTPDTPPTTPTDPGETPTTDPPATADPTTPTTPPTTGPGSGIEIVSLKGVRLNATSIVLTRAGERFALDVIGVLSNGSTQSIRTAADGTSYANSNTAAVSVSPDGVLTAIGSGIATVTATNGGFSAGVPVLVDLPTDSPAFQSLEVTPTSVLLLEPTQTQQLVVLGAFTDGSRRDITTDPLTIYSSSDTGIATVSPAGLISPVADGDAIVTVSHRGTVFSVGVQVAFAARALSSSPGNGEGDVALTRETIIRFSTPLNRATVNGANLFATFGGAVLNTNLYISKDARSATLFYPDHLPASARVRVTLIGDSITDTLGRTLDADGDGVPGGTRVIDFDTLSITVVPGTSVVGRVFASELATTPGGGSINRPLEGVTLSVDGAESTIRTTTDAFGNFRLDPAPGGKFFVHVDGRTATVGVPPGAYYPFVGKAWEALPGKENNVGDIYLPLIPPGSLVPVSTTADTEIGFSAATIAAFPEFSGAKIMIPADSLFSDDGTRGGMVGIAPVPPDRLPGVLPESLNFPLVITVQTDGATNFDRPAPVCFPNLEGLPPGATTALWSFNHDIGDWEIVGQCTISSDGRFACSNPGVGILAPGWHGIQVGVQGSGGGIGGGGCNTLSDNAEDTIVCVKKPVTFCAVIEGPGGMVDWTGGGMPATGTGTTFTTMYDTPGVKTVTAKLTPANGDPPVMDSGSITVIKIEIMDDMGNMLDPMTTVTDPLLTTVAQQVSLKAMVTPAVASATKEWKVGGSNIRIYEHDIDEAAKHKTIALMDAELKNKDDIKFFWTDAGSGVTVSFKVKKGASECEEIIKFDVMQDADANHNIYAQTDPGAAMSDPKKNPNGDGKTYRVLTSHHAWHAGGMMDDGAAPVDSVGNWGDVGSDGNANFDRFYNGSSFLLWHWEFIKAHQAWRSTFNVGALKTAVPPPASDPTPDYLKATPPAMSTQESDVYGYVRLGEFKDLFELGRDTVSPWHNNGHGTLAGATGDADMGGFSSPRAMNDLFWAWHGQIDSIRAAYAKDQAMTTTLVPADGGTVGGPVTEIIVTFDKRVSLNNGFDPSRAATNTEKITAGALKVNGSAATMIDDVGGAGSRFMVYRFRGFAAPPNGAVTVELTGTGSFAGKMWTFTQN